MHIFKFGGASIKDAKSIKNVVSVLQTVGYNNTLIIVSAMGKTTNALEKVVHNYLHHKEEFKSAIQEVKKYHNAILLDLFDHERHSVFNQINRLFDELLMFFKSNKSPDYNFIYDQTVCYGELISSTIINAYLIENNINNDWLDARECIQTDTYYRNAKVDWKTTQQLISNNINTNILQVTQGFIASDSNNFTTTLGREGSDYTAAIFAYCLNAESVTIWKDVPGVLNADPRYFENTQLLEYVSYNEAIELAFYGASVIHPKTIQPLQRKEIPLFVKSFLNPKNEGTKVSKGVALKPQTPCFILKHEQILISLSSLDFSFIVEDNISAIFKLLHHYKMKVNMIQNSAISFSVCMDNKYNNLDALLLKLKAKFKITFYENVSLYTIRHYTKEAIQSIETDKIVLLKQLHLDTVQIVTK